MDAERRNFVVLALRPGGLREPRVPFERGGNPPAVGERDNQLGGCESNGGGTQIPTSISKMLIPAFHKLVAMFSQVPNDRTKLVVPEARIDRQAKIMQPELCFLVAALT